MTILAHPIWTRIRSYLHITACDADGHKDDPRIRIEFLGVPLALLHEGVMIQMPCVACGRPVNPLRRREGDADRLYYAPACLVRVRIRCSRGREARDEYDRFKEIDAERIRNPEKYQLSLF